MKIGIKRAYAAPSPEDGARFLVDRFWPRGVKKENLELVAWLRDAAPSAALCHWFGHDPARWEEFRNRYRVELHSQATALQPLRQALARGMVTLVYSARDEQHNQAIVLRDFLLESQTPARKARK